MKQFSTLLLHVAILYFSQNAVFKLLGLILMPYIGPGPPKSSKRYDSDLFKKSVPNMATYPSGILSQLQFPKGGSY